MIARRLLHTTPFFRSHVLKSTRIASSDAFIVSRDVNPATATPTGVVTVAFNRPKNLNAMTEETGIEFKNLIEKTLAPDTSIRALILTGSDPYNPPAPEPVPVGKKPRPAAFSAGGDLKFLRARTKDSPHHNAEIMRDFYARFLAIRKLPYPTIAAINGHAVGAGACISLACDLRLMASDNGAKIGFNFVKLGLTPGMGGSFMLPNLIGHQNASRLLLTGDLISAQEAKDLGLVLSIHKQSDLFPESLALARKIASASPVSVRGVVKTMRNGFDATSGGIELALWREADTQAICYQSEDMREGLDAIGEGREPVFKDF
ncbi:UNVERIFIED_CONTAM: putative enoyl CoA hydratase [Siphonaria sp. JEL0065]|nr:putative enoyl CoA hydratase [Siphonaria sp. JEL0065]